MRNKDIIDILIITSIILFIPLVAMQFSNEVVWTGEDFIIMGILTLGSGFIYKLISNKIKDKIKRRLMIGGLVLSFLYLWAELAVGIFTNLGS